jgi:hypothetical protein
MEMQASFVMAGLLSATGAVRIIARAAMTPYHAPTPARQDSWAKPGNGSRLVAAITRIFREWSNIAEYPQRRALIMLLKSLESTDSWVRLVMAMSNVS